MAGRDVGFAGVVVVRRTGVTVLGGLVRVDPVALDFGFVFAFGFGLSGPGGLSEIAVSPESQSFSRRMSFSPLGRFPLR